MGISNKTISDISNRTYIKTGPKSSTRYFDRKRKRKMKVLFQLLNK